MIAGVQIKEFSDITNEQGGIQRMLRADDELFERFGEIYFSIIKPGVTKGWNLHAKQTNILSCIVGKVKLKLKDLRENSPTKNEIASFDFGDGERKLIKIPPGVAAAWKNKGSQDAMLANLASHPHDPEEATKIPFEELSFGGD